VASGAHFSEAVEKFSEELKLCSLCPPVAKCTRKLRRFASLSLAHKVFENLQIFGYPKALGF